MGDENFSLIGTSTVLSDLTAYSDLDEGVLTLNMAGDNWVKQGGYSDSPKDTFDVYRGIKDITADERGKFFFDRECKAVWTIPLPALTRLKTTSSSLAIHVQ